MEHIFLAAFRRCPCRPGRERGREKVMRMSRTRGPSGTDKRTLRSFQLERCFRTSLWRGWLKGYGSEHMLYHIIQDFEFRVEA